MDIQLAKRFKKGWQILWHEGPVKFAFKVIKFAWYLCRVAYWHLAGRLGLARPAAIPFTGELAFLANPLFNITAGDIEDSQVATKVAKPAKIKSATWFVPYFDHVAFGGIQTIFRFINYLSRQGVQNRIVIYDRHDISARIIKADIVKDFPDLDSATLVIFDPQQQRVEDLPPTDIAFATKWESAYFLLRFNQTARKYYFIQDYEPLFYQAGSTYALAESTYRFGFTGVVNTPGLLAAVSNRHGLTGTSFVPAVDKRYYYPAKSPKQHDKVRIFFYTRPNNPRNAFELIILIMHGLVAKYQDQIEIVAAGAIWNEAKYGLEGKIKNLGLLSDLKLVGDLYRTCDIGFVYMLSKHPSYQPFEFMASGMATVTNNNEDNLWFLKDQVNCLLAEPSPAAVVEKISQLVDDPELRAKIASAGHKGVNTNWTSELEQVWDYLQKP